MWRISRTFGFEAAHFLEAAGGQHPCSRLHGHSYKVRLEIEGDVDPAKGWVIDFDAVDDAARPIRQRLDHTLLNEVAGLAMPTAERIAEWIFAELVDCLPGLSAVTVYETESSEATYIPS